MLSTDSFWYFDYGTTRHVKRQQWHLNFLKDFFHKNTIIIAWKETHHVVQKGSMIAKFKIGEIKNIWRFFMYQTFKKTYCQ